MKNLGGGVYVTNGTSVMTENEPEEIEILREKVKELEQWKKDMISVTPPLQEIAKELDLQLGDKIHDKILPGIIKLKDILRSVASLDLCNGCCKRNCSGCKISKIIEQVRSVK